MSPPRKPAPKKGNRAGNRPTGGSSRKPVPARGRTGPGGRGRSPQNQGPPVVGKRPSNPTFLAVVGLVWIAAAVGAALLIHRVWWPVPVICFAGVGFFYLRGAAGAYARRAGPDDE
jgi:hypothetical protein